MRCMHIQKQKENMAKMIKSLVHNINVLILESA